ncbi:uncharacterized protein LOC135208260 [Macrobrachium nipponense]|uniref:uncharacterized protein LOC135208260 n=1 Tax=Macrobrachium nipponense TaxID=159736 RepID=UPI0030C89F54
MGNKPGYQKVSTVDKTGEAEGTPLAPETTESTESTRSCSTDGKDQTAGSQARSYARPKVILREKSRTRHSSANTPMQDTESRLRSLSTSPSAASSIPVRSRHSSLHSDRGASRPIFADETPSASLQGAGGLVAPASSQFSAADATPAMRFIKHCRKSESPKKDKSVDRPVRWLSRTPPPVDPPLTASSELEEETDLLRACEGAKGAKKKRKMNRPGSSPYKDLNPDSSEGGGVSSMTVPWH